MPTSSAAKRQPTAKPLTRHKALKKKPPRKIQSSVESSPSSSAPSTATLLSWRGIGGNQESGDSESSSSYSEHQNITNSPGGEGPSPLQTPSTDTSSSGILRWDEVRSAREAFVLQSRMLRKANRSSISKTPNHKARRAKSAPPSRTNPPEDSTTAERLEEEEAAMSPHPPTVETPKTSEGVSIAEGPQEKPLQLELSPLPQRKKTSHKANEPTLKTPELTATPIEGRAMASVMSEPTNSEPEFQKGDPPNNNNSSEGAPVPAAQGPSQDLTMGPVGERDSPSTSSSLATPP